MNSDFWGNRIHNKLVLYRMSYNVQYPIANVVGSISNIQIIQHPSSINIQEACLSINHQVHVSHFQAEPAGPDPDMTTLTLILVSSIHMSLCS